MITKGKNGHWYDSRADRHGPHGRREGAEAETEEEDLRGGEDMVKRILFVLLVCAAVRGGIYAEPILAAGIKAPYMAEQAEGKAPDVKVYMTGSRADGKIAVSAKIGKKAFAQKGKAVSFRKSNEGIYYIVLLDNSGSVNRVQFEEAKRQLVNMRSSLRKRDKMLLYTVGSFSAAGHKKNVFGKTVKGSDTAKKQSDCQTIKNITYMASPLSKTVLYRSLNEVLAAQASPRMRTVVVMITDGEDDSEGKDMDKVSTAWQVKNASVPVYGIILRSHFGRPDEKKISYTRNKILAERNCRGFYYDCAMEETGEKVKTAFQALKQIWFYESYIVRLCTKTNTTAGRAKLDLTVNKSAIDSVRIDYSDYVSDKNAPVFVGAVKRAGAKSISFSLHDDYGIKASDLRNTANYMVQAKEEKGKMWTVKSVNMAQDTDKTVITLSLEEELYAGAYLLRCTGIRDESQDANEMSDSLEFVIEDGRDAKHAARMEFLKSYWWMGLTAVVLVLGINMMVIIRKHAGKPEPVNPEELVRADTKLIRLTITDRLGHVRDMPWSLEGSLFFGRSNICNIFFDDDRLSKQHFVIETTRMGCFIEDLGSTNGTFVNGVKLATRRMVLDGDIITAGREKIVFHVEKNQLSTGKAGE